MQVAPTQPAHGPFPHSLEGLASAEHSVRLPSSLLRVRFTSFPSVLWKREPAARRVAVVAANAAPPSRPMQPVFPQPPELVP